MLRPSLLAASVSTVLAACGSGTREVQPDDYFSAGVEPGPALDEATEVLATHGLLPVSRVDSERFSAAAFADPGGRTGLRVTSQRGTALAMDADSEEGALLTLDPRTGTDLTGDGHGDLIVVRTETSRVCLALAEVDAHGGFRAMPADVAWLDPRLCVGELIDLDHDARVEALVIMPLADLGAPAPTVSVPLGIDRRRVFVHGAWPPGFGESEIARRDASLEVAVDRGDVPTATRLAIELAHVTALRGGSDADIAACLSRVRALAIDREVAARLTHAEERAIALRAASRPAPDPEPVREPEPETSPVPSESAAPSASVEPVAPTSASASASD